MYILVFPFQFSLKKLKICQCTEGGNQGNSLFILIQSYKWKSKGSKGRIVSNNNNNYILMKVKILFKNFNHILRSPSLHFNFGTTNGKTHGPNLFVFAILFNIL